MVKRTISDEEISLIKAMINRGMKNKNIQFFFNKPDRPVNSGRITDISNGKYSDSAQIAAATDEEIDNFIGKFKPYNVSASIVVPSIPIYANQEHNPISPEVIQSFFHNGGDGLWRLTNGESDQHECKANFGTKHPGSWLKAIAALSNNRGGYIFFGVKDKDSEHKDGVDMSYAVIGMSSDEFIKIDAEDITKRIKSAFDPTPRVQMSVVKIGGKAVGVIYVHQHKSRPVIALKNEGDQVKEGDILFRYPGQSSRIKYGDLRSLLDERDAQARLNIMPMVERLLSIGSDKAMIADLTAGVLSDGKNPILIDEDLLGRINFIREGDFSEKGGAPTLRLIGDVQAMESSIILKKGFLIAEDIIRDFINQEAPYDPGEYIRCAVEGMKSDWLPIHYFAMKASLDMKSLVSLIETTSATVSRKDLFVKRASMEISAYKKATGTPLIVKKEIEEGNIINVESEKDASHIALAICGFSERPEVHISYFLELLKKCFGIARDAQKDSAMSFLRRAVCRVDELFFAEKINKQI